MADAGPLNHDEFDQSAASASASASAPAPATATATATATTAAAPSSPNVSGLSASGFQSPIKTSNSTDSYPHLLDETTSVPLPRRRNNKLPSCEPCRKAKAACDHTLPKCRRCMRKGIVDKCIYHPAPMTRGVAGAEHSGVGKLHKRDSRSVSNAADAAVSNLLLLLSQQRTPDAETINPDDSQEYLGPTSYNAVFQESIDSFGPDILTKNADEAQSQGGSNSADVINPEHVEICVSALQSFPDQELGERLLARYFSHCDVILHEPSTWYGFRSLWSTWGKALKNKDKASLQAMAETIIDPPYFVLRSYRSSAEWLDSFTGDKLKVVMVGNLLAAFGLAAITIPEWDPLFNDPRGVNMTRKQYVYQVGTASEACIRLCTMKVNSSEPLIWLLHNVEILQSQYSGDESISASSAFCRLIFTDFFKDGYLWRKAGHVATAITALGLHREDTMNPGSVPFMITELRKRTFASVFVTDKQLATFTGRPPRVSRRYSYCKLPLDLTDEEIMAEGEELQQHLDQLDRDGWNRHAKPRYVTFQRGHMLMALLRDEVLEVCLGPSAGVSSAQREELKQRCEATYNTFPESLRFDISKSVPIGESKLARRVFLRLECLLHLFLLERLAIPEGAQYNMQSLINISKTILEHIVVLARHRDRLADNLYMMTFSLAYFGLPSAGILVLELLKQHKYPRQYFLSLPRSETVQLLSVFLFCLDLVGPDEGNYKICIRMKKVIRNSLDRVLEQRVLGNGPEELITPADTNLPMLDVDMPTMIGSDSNDPDFIDWLSSVDWSRGPWVDTL